MGVQLQARCFIVRFEDGSLWLHSPAPPDARLKSEIDALGEVRWLVLPNKWHHLGATESVKAWPTAQLVVAPSLVQRRPDLRPDHVLGRGADALWPEMAALPLAGVPYLDETCFFHHPTGTLIAADLLIRASDHDHWSLRAVGRVAGIRDQPGPPPDVRLSALDQERCRDSVARLLELPIVRICASHMEPVQDNPKAVLAEAWGLSVS